jgi:ribosomal protein S12 methylthiotransferase accessory factor
VPPDLVFFLADEDARCVRGEGWVRLAPLLGGSLDLEGVAAAADLLVEEAAAALASLARQGLLADDDGPPVPDRPPGEERGPNAPAPGPRLVLHGDAPGLRQALDGAPGALAAPDTPGAAVHLVAVEDYLDPELARLAAAVPAGRPWLPLKAAGERPWIGPLFGAGGEACPGCLQVALARARPVAALYYHLSAGARRVPGPDPAPAREGTRPSPTGGAGGQARSGHASPATDPAPTREGARPSPTGGTGRGGRAARDRARCGADLQDVEEATRRRAPVGAGLVPAREGAVHVSPARAAWVCDEIGRRLADGSLADTLWVLDPATGDAATHRLRREADCPLCGEGPAPPGPIPLGPRPIAHRADGGFRSERPAETRRRLAAMVDPLTGPVREVRGLELPGAAAPCVAVATYPHPLPPATWRQLRARPRVAAAGKGASPDQAIVGAIAEAVERSCGVFRGDEPRRASLEELGEEAITPDELLLYSDRQLAGGEAPAARWRPDRQTEWTAIHSLADGRRRWMPTALAFHGYRPPPGAWGHPADSNGCAAGRCPEEAVLQGLLELVERDAVALWWYNALARPRLDPGADPRAAALEVLCRGHGRELVLLDLTSDLGLPVVAAAALPEDGEGRPLFGFGGHLDPALALGRALGELGQFLPAADGTSRADRRASARVPPWLAPATSAPADAILPCGPACEDFSAALALVLDRLAGAGLEAWALDQTRDRAVLSVVRVVAPGLRPWTRRLAPGRLYDVPVAMAWRPAPRAEDEMERQPLYA